MPVKAKLNYLRIAPRKVRLVADLLRGKRVQEALTLLDFTTKRAVKPLKKLLLSAIANARHNFGIKRSNLYISKILVNEGPTLKRVRPRAFGRFFPINKRTSHVELVLEQVQGRSRGVKRLKRRKKKERIKKKPRREFKRPQKKPEIERKRPRVRKKPKRIFKRKAF